MAVQRYDRDKTLVDQDWVANQVCSSSGCACRVVRSSNGGLGMGLQRRMVRLRGKGAMLHPVMVDPRGIQRYNKYQYQIGQDQ